MSTSRAVTVVPAAGGAVGAGVAAVVGGAVGAGVGAVVGAAVGAAVGAVVDAVVGAVVGVAAAIVAAAPLVLVGAAPVVAVGSAIDADGEGVRACCADAVGDGRAVAVLLVVLAGTPATACVQAAKAKSGMMRRRMCFLMSRGYEGRLSDH